MYQKFFTKRKMDKIIIACDEGIESFFASTDIMFRKNQERMGETQQTLLPAPRWWIAES